MATTVQINARLDRETKRSGDEALALIGLGPTQAIRALWEKAALRGRDLEQIAELLCPRETDHAEQADPLIEGRKFMRDAYEKLGIDLSMDNTLPSDQEMLEEGLHDREIEKGLA